MKITKPPKSPLLNFVMLNVKLFLTVVIHESPLLNSNSFNLALGQLWTQISQPLLELQVFTMIFNGKLCSSTFRNHQSLRHGFEVVYLDNIVWPCYRWVWVLECWKCWIELDTEVYMSFSLEGRSTLKIVVGIEVGIKVRNVSSQLGWMLK